MPIRPFATAVVKKLVDAGHIAYFAGGWVRDFLMKHPSDDIDIATSASVEEIQSLFPKTIPVGIAFGIVIVVQEGHTFEVATFRKEKGYLDGRRPTHIEPTSPEEDAKRRDFTINGMFYDPLNEKLYDYVNGQEDLRKGVIRAIGDTHERFLEDRLRMMRAVRYSTRFGFTIEPNTEQAILSHSAALLPSVAMERIWQEFKKMSQFAHFDKGLVTLHRLQLLPTIFPSLRSLPLSEIQSRLSYLPLFPKKTPTIIELLELFPNDSLEKRLELCEYLKLSKEERETVQFFHRAQNLLAMPKEWLDKLELVEWAHFYAHPQADLCIEIQSLRADRDSFLSIHKERKDRLQKAIFRIQAKQPVVRAEDLIREGIIPGKTMGLLLKEAERISVNNFLENKNEVLSKLKKSQLWSF